MPREDVQRRLPAKDTRPIGATKRWSELERLMLVGAALGELSLDEIRKVAHGQKLHDLDKYEQRFRPIFKAQTERLVALANADVQKLEHDGADAAAARAAAAKVNRRAVRKCITKWTQRLLQDGQIHDCPPHPPGYRVQRNMETLTEIRRLLMAGWQDAKGQTCLFRSLKDLENRKPAEFKPLREKMQGVTTLRGLWSQLTTAFPAMRVMAVRSKKERTGAEVQVRRSRPLCFADPALGPMMCSSCVHEGCCRLSCALHCVRCHCGLLYGWC